MAKPKALIFDLDGVLVDSEPLHLRTWREAFEATGVPFPLGDEARLRGRRGEDILAWLKGRLGDAMSDDSGECLLRAKRERFHALIRQGALPAVPGVEEFLRRNKGIYPLGLVTSSRLEAVGQIMLAQDWRNIFDALIGAQHVTESKPHPEPYLRAAERFKLPPAQCLVFEDSDVGVESARRAGCPVVGVRTSLTPRELYALGADWVIPDFRDEATLAQALAGERPRGFARLKRRILGESKMLG